MVNLLQLWQKYKGDKGVGIASTARLLNMRLSGNWQVISLMELYKGWRADGQVSLTTKLLQPLPHPQEQSRGMPQTICFTSLGRHNLHRPETHNNRQAAAAGLISYQRTCQHWFRMPRHTKETSRETAVPDSNLWFPKCMPQTTEPM